MTDFRAEAVELVRANGYRDLCEVGVWRGELARLLAPLARTLVLVDPYSALWNRFDLPSGEYSCTMGEEGIGQWELNQMHAAVCQEFRSALVLRMPSTLAAQHVPDRSLDFVYIDAVHTFAACLADIKAWLPKIRCGGMIAGDDYIPAHPQAVAEAVDVAFPDRKGGRGDRTWWEKVP